MAGAGKKKSVGRPKTNSTAVTQQKKRSAATIARYVKPTDIAREEDIPPQYIYNWVKHNKIAYDTSTGSVRVDEEDTRDRIRKWRAAKDSGLRRVPTGHGANATYSTKPPYRIGAMFTYHPRMTRRKPVLALVVKTDKFFTYVKTNTIVTPKDLSRRTERMPEGTWRNESLRSLIDSKTVAMVNPWEVIQMLEEQFRIVGQTERADRLHEWFVTEAKRRKSEVDQERAAKSSNQSSQSGS